MGTELVFDQNEGCGLGLDPDKMHALMLASLPLLLMVLSQRVLGFEVMTRILVLVLIH